MAGIAIVLALWRKNPGFCSPQTDHSSGFLSAASAASAPFASRFLFGSPKIPVAYCDASAAITDEYISNLRKVPGNIFQPDAIKYTTKESFLMYYLPLLEPNLNTEADDDNFLQESQEEHVDLVVPFKKSLKQIVREMSTTVVTPRRILERLAVQYVSERTAWKLLRDAPKSAMQKAERGLPTFVYFVRVSQTTFRGHFLGVAATWIVQVGLEVYLSVSCIMKSGEESNKFKSQEAKLLGKRFLVLPSGVVCNTRIQVLHGSSLVIASIRAGIGVTIIRPSVSQWIGCAVGDLAGPIIVTFCLDKALHLYL